MLKIKALFIAIGLYLLTPICMIFLILIGLIIILTIVLIIILVSLFGPAAYAWQWYQDEKITSLKRKYND